MQRTLTAVAVVGVLVGGYYIAMAAEQTATTADEHTNSHNNTKGATNEHMGAYSYYDQPEFDVTFDGEVIYIWEDAQ